MTLMTNVRAGRATALLAAFQPAKGTIVDDLSAATRLWTGDFTMPPDIHDPSDEAWTTSPKAPHQDEQFNKPVDVTGLITCMASPAALQMLLTSNWGEVFQLTAFPGDPPNPYEFLLRYQVPAFYWMTLAWVENTVAGGPGYLVRVRDAWIHKLAFIGTGPMGQIWLAANYAGRDIPAPVDLASLGGVTLPSSYTPDQQVFDMRSTVVTVDPTGTPIVLAPSNITLTFEQGLYNEYDQMAGLMEVHKLGRVDARLELEARVSDETWARLIASRAGTKERIRIVFSAPTPAPAKTLTVEIYAMTLAGNELGHAGLDYRDIKLTGHARIDGSDQFVDLTLSA